MTNSLNVLVLPSNGSFWLSALLLCSAVVFKEAGTAAVAHDGQIHGHVHVDERRPTQEASAPKETRDPTGAHIELIGGHVDDASNETSALKKTGAAAIGIGEHIGDPTEKLLGMEQVLIADTLLEAANVTKPMDDPALELQSPAAHEAVQMSKVEQKPKAKSEEDPQKKPAGHKVDQMAAVMKADTEQPKSDVSEMNGSDAEAGDDSESIDDPAQETHGADSTMARVVIVTPAYTEEAEIIKKYAAPVLPVNKQNLTRDASVPERKTTIVTSEKNQGAQRTTIEDTRIKEAVHEASGPPSILPATGRNTSRKGKALQIADGEPINGTKPKISSPTTTVRGENVSPMISTALSASTTGTPPNNVRTRTPTPKLRVRPAMATETQTVTSAPSKLPIQRFNQVTTTTKRPTADKQNGRSPITADSHTEMISVTLKPVVAPIRKLKLRTSAKVADEKTTVTRSTTKPHETDEKTTVTSTDKRKDLQMVSLYITKKFVPRNTTKPITVEENTNN